MWKVSLRKPRENLCTNRGKKSGVKGDIMAKIACGRGETRERKLEG